MNPIASLLCILLHLQGWVVAEEVAVMEVRYPVIMAFRKGNFPFEPPCALMRMSPSCLLCLNSPALLYATVLMICPQGWVEAVAVHLEVRMLTVCLSKVTLFARMQDHSLGSSMLALT